MCIRDRALRGWVSGPFHVKAFVEGIGRLTDDAMALAIYDGPADQPASLLYQSASFVPNEVRGFAGARTIEAAGRNWTVVVQPLPAFEQGFAARDRHLIALLAIALSLAVGWFTWYLSIRRDDALALAEGMTHALRGARDDLQATLDATPDWMFELDAEGRVLHCHNAPESALHAQATQLVGRSLPEAASSKTAYGCQAALDTAAARGYSFGHDFQLVVDGESRWFELSVARKKGTEGVQVVRFIALLRDVSERKQAAQRTHRLAYFDPLTELPNRRMLLDRLAQALGAASHASRFGALIFMDLDNFKQINDAQGHSVGDQLLVQVAHRLMQAMRPTDTVAHIGGDEFVMLVSDISDEVDEAGMLALRLADGLRESLEAPFNLGGHAFASTASIGLTLFPKQGEGVEDLLREADTAMYRAKDLGRNRICFFESAMQTDVQRRLTLEQDLKVAFVDAQLSAFVQPQVDCAGTVVGGELLMRWQHPQRGLVSPAQFIPLAEETGLIVPIGSWVLRQACAQFVRWRREGLPLSVISVNVSVRQLEQDTWLEVVRNALKVSRLAPSYLDLEITESVIISNADKAVATLSRLKQMGVTLTMDDFGTGYSSLYYLTRLPLNNIKIDQKFIRGLDHDRNDEAITHANNRILYGNRVTDFPHVRRMLADAYARLVAMKVFAARSADYFRSSSAEDRRHALPDEVWTSRRAAPQRQRSPVGRLARAGTAAGKAQPPLRRTFGRQQQRRGIDATGKCDAELDPRPVGNVSLQEFRERSAGQPGGEYKRSGAKPEGHGAAREVEDFGLAVVVDVHDVHGAPPHTFSAASLMAARMRG